MKINLEELKRLVEAGDETALTNHIFTSMEKGDLKSVAATNKDVKSELDSAKDTHHSTALETWKNNNLNTLIEEEMKKRNPDKTPEQLELEKLRKEIEDEKKARSRQELSNKAIKIANEKKLPVDLVDYFLAEDEEKTTANLQKLEEVFNASLKAGVDERFKQKGRDFKGGSNDPDSPAAQFAQNANKQSEPVEHSIWK